MRLRTGQVRNILISRAIQEFLVGLSHKELDDFYDWVLKLVESKNGVKYRLEVTNSEKQNETEILYNSFVSHTISGIDKDYNRRRKVTRMVEGTKDKSKELLASLTTTLILHNITLDRKKLLIVFEYLFTVFYYKYDSINDIVNRYQNLAYVLIVVHECEEVMLESIALHNLAYGTTILHTVFEGGKQYAINW